MNKVYHDNKLSETNDTHYKSESTPSKLDERIIHVHDSNRDRPPAIPSDSQDENIYTLSCQDSIGTHDNKLSQTNNIHHISASTHSKLDQRIIHDSSHDRSPAILGIKQTTYKVQDVIYTLNKFVTDARSIIIHVGINNLKDESVQEIFYKYDEMVYTHVGKASSVVQSLVIPTKFTKLN
ncbi:unnamed protein product [Mytilus coruscus]|uniref:Uncharacterized protein n=1 Tax=Mytilus coruscus TaxID=42192 RepID=A0A6J8D338_MYTCO|nr:unnamed protein product [Mytilus coruscus]